MKIAMIGFCVSLILAFNVSAESSPNYTDPTYGFSITTPKFPVGAPNTVTNAIISMGPPSDGFAPNLNVQVQALATTLADYARYSREQLRKEGYLVRAEESVKLGSEPGVLWYYSGTTNGRPLEFVSVAMVFDQKILLATGAATPAQFKEVGAILRSSILSIRLPEQ